VDGRGVVWCCRVLCSRTCNSHFILFCFAVLFAFCFLFPPSEVSGWAVMGSELKSSTVEKREMF